MNRPGLIIIIFFTMLYMAEMKMRIGTGEYRPEPMELSPVDQIGYEFRTSPLDELVFEPEDYDSVSSNE